HLDLYGFRQCRALRSLCHPLVGHCRPTLFPYTTLFRSPTFSRIWFIKIATVLDLLIAPDNFLNACDIKRACKPTCESPISPSIRSEEHTSELQSRVDLVCRLLLAKNSRLAVSPA